VADRTKIEATGLVDVRRSTDGALLHIRLLDAAGRTISLSLPVGCLNAVLTAMPQRVESDAVHPLDTWTMVAAENGQDLVLTLHAPDGCTVSFATKPYQVQGMATIATYGIPDRPTTKRLH
jgi:hypothetical protein